MRTWFVSLLVAALTTTVIPAAAVAEPVPVDTFLNIAHRGASGLAPEHTFPAWDLALELGADYIEQDVALTRDGVLVVLHDDTLDRTARGPAENCSGSVRSKTLAQLRTCDMGSWFNERYPDRARPEYVGLQIPTLAEVFRRYGEGAAYHIETKSPEQSGGEAERELLRLLHTYGLHDDAVQRGSVLVQSFSPLSLQLLSRLDPAMPLVQLLAGAPPAPAREVLLDAVRGYAIGVGPSHGGVDQGFVDAAHSRCLVVHPYTVDDPQRMAELIGFGVDGIFTNRPDVLHDVLGRDDEEPRPDAVALAYASNRDCRGG